MIKVLKRYLNGELHTAVYWAIGLTCPVLILLFLIDVVHDWVVMGMRREMLLELGALPQIAAGAFGMALAATYAFASFWGITRKIRRNRSLANRGATDQ